MTNNRSSSNKYDEERLRAAEQSQVVYLQGQIDELRRLLKEQGNKYGLVIEQVRKIESSVVQVEGLFDRHRADIALSTDAARRDIAGLRKEVASALVKIEEGTRPIREMQAQIQQVAEARKQDRDYVAGWLVRIDDLEQRLTAVVAQVREADERHRALASRIESFTSADDAIRIDVRKLGEDLQIEKQSLRRQAIEAQQLVTDLHPTLSAYASRIDRLEQLRHRLDELSEQFPVQITSLDLRLTEQLGEIRRVERISTERFLMNQERVEEIRQQQEEKITTLVEADDQHLRQVTSWLERLDAWTRELEQRYGRLGSRFEQIQREHHMYLNDLEGRDTKLLEVMIAALRTQFEAIKAEQVERGRTPQE